MARGNFTNNRGPKTLSGRLNQLRGLRNVGIKIATDKQYLDQMYDDGMDFVSKRKKREASKLENEFNRVVRDNIIKPKDFNKNYEAPKEWLSDYEARKNEHDLSLRDAQEINKQVVKRTTTSSPFTAGRRSIPNYGNGPQTWLPSRPRPSSVFNDTEDEWYSNYKKLQTKKDYY